MSAVSQTIDLPLLTAERQAKYGMFGIFNRNRNDFWEGSSEERKEGDLSKWLMAKDQGWKSKGDRDSQDFYPLSTSIELV